MKIAFMISSSGQRMPYRIEPMSTQSLTGMQLSLVKTFNSPTVIAGGPSKTFTLAATNSGVSDADNVVLTDSVDHRLHVDAISVGSYTCDPASQSIHCTLPPIISFGYSQSRLTSMRTEHSRRKDRVYPYVRAVWEREDKLDETTGTVVPQDSYYMLEYERLTDGVYYFTFRNSLGAPAEMGMAANDCDCGYAEVCLIPSAEWDTIDALLGKTPWATPTTGDAMNPRLLTEVLLAAPRSSNDEKPACCCSTSESTRGWVIWSCARVTIVVRAGISELTSRLAVG